MQPLSSSTCSLGQSCHALWIVLEFFTVYGMLSFCLHSLQPLFSSSGRPISAKRHWDDFALDSDEEDDFDWADEGGSADQPSLPVHSALQHTPPGIGCQNVSAH